MPVVLFELVLVLIVAYVSATQVIWPALRGTPLFPVLRREHQLHAELEEKRQRAIERELARDVDRIDQQEN